MKTNSLKTNRTIWLGAAVSVALLLLASPRTARAQQWTGPDGSNNISNANTGNVGVGLTVPLHKFDVLSGTNIIARFGSSASGTSQLLINATSGSDSKVTWQNGGTSKWFLGNRAANDRFSFESSGSVEVFSILQNGHVGIGTITPDVSLGDTGQSTTLAVQGISAYSMLRLMKNTTGAVGVGRVTFGSSGYSGAEKRTAVIISSSENAATDNPTGNLGFYTTNAGTIGERIRITGSGNVGIGTTSPASILTVQTTGGDTAGEKYLRVKNTNSFTGIAIDGGQAGDVDWLLLGGYPSAGDFTVRESGVANYLTIKKTTGNVGIGMSPTGNKLDVAGNINASGTISASGVINALGGLNINGSPVTSSQWTTSGSNINYATAGNVGIGIAPTEKLHVSGNIKATGTINAVGGLNINGSPVTSSQWTTSGSNINYATAGNVGIGIAPTEKLHVSGNIKATGTINAVGGLNINGSPVTSSQWTTSGSNINYATAGNVGIGIAPTEKLHVSGNIKATGTINAVGGLNVNGSPVTSSQWTTSGSNINYATAGNVGIGTASPTYKLHVTGDGRLTGNLTVDGTINAKYQDVAEWVPSSEQIFAGTVVVLDTTKSNQVIASTQSYDTRVAGVISAQPGITLGEGGEGKVLVATTGRVLVQVDTSKGAIHIGDLLVTSDVPGVAMKSTPVNLSGIQLHRPGTIIGKALEPLEKGSGKILVLLSLQ